MQRRGARFTTDVLNNSSPNDAELQTLWTGLTQTVDCRGNLQLPALPALSLFAAADEKVDQLGSFWSDVPYMDDGSVFVG